MWKLQNNMRWLLFPIIRITKELKGLVRKE